MRARTDGYVAVWYGYDALFCETEGEWFNWLGFGRAIARRASDVFPAETTRDTGARALWRENVKLE